MNKQLSNLVDLIRAQFPKMDVRTDQSEMVRAMTKGLLVTLEQLGDRFVAKVISLESEYDFESTLLKTLSSDDRASFETQVLAELQRRIPR